MENEAPNLIHPTDDELAAYLGNELEGEALRRLELHLARCATCREEMLDAKEILRKPRKVPWRVVAPVAAAAAMVVLFLPGPNATDPVHSVPTHREAPKEVGIAPVPISPVGTSSEVDALVWAPVTGADRYRLTIYDADGTVVWRETTADSLISLPDSLSLVTDRSYLWQVEARVGWDVWESSDLVEFQVGGSPGPSNSPGRLP